MLPIFTVKLNHRLMPGLVTLGVYDGSYPCLTAATGGDKVLVHNPHERSGDMGGRMSGSRTTADVAILNVNQQITALTCGRLRPEGGGRSAGDNNSTGDVLCVGTQSSLLVYDVANNADLFYRELPDGANAMAIGRLGGRAESLLLVGGSCALQGFTADGSDPYWNVTGDTIRSLALMDFRQRGHNQLLVGSDDFEIRVFDDDDIVYEVNETEAVTALRPLGDQSFGYALSNGTVGVYEPNGRRWRIKSKNKPVALQAFDIDQDGVPELITAWNNGKVDARSDYTGEVVFKDTFNVSAAGLAVGDYRMDGKDALICCSVDGEIRGFSPASAAQRRGMASAVGSSVAQEVDSSSIEQQTLFELSQRRQNLLSELKNYEENSRTQETARGGGPPLGADNVGVIPARTQVETGLTVRPATDTLAAHIELTLATTNDTIMRAAIIFAEGIFQGESHVVHPPENLCSNAIRVPLFPPRDVNYDLHIKTMVGYASSQHYHVFELTVTLHRFAMYAVGVLYSDTKRLKSASPRGYVALQVKDRVQRVVIWLNQNFLLPSELTATDSLNVEFVSLRTESQLQISMDGGGRLQVRTDDMELAGDIVQALCGFLKIEELNAEADFPDELDQLTAILERVNELRAASQRLSAEMADYSGAVRSLVVRAEDARLMADMRSMRRWYAQLYDVNRDLIADYKIRANNHGQLMAALKLVNQTIQRAGRLRVGRYQTAVIAACRQAVKNNNTPQLINAIRSGST